MTIDDCGALTKSKAADECNEGNGLLIFGLSKCRCCQDAGTTSAASLDLTLLQTY